MNGVIDKSQVVRDGVGRRQGVTRTNLLGGGIDDQCILDNVLVVGACDFR